MKLAIFAIILNFVLMGMFSVKSTLKVQAHSHAETKAARIFLTKNS